MTVALLIYAAIMTVGFAGIAYPRTRRLFLTAAFGWGATTAAWLQSDERKNYETTRRAYASGRMCLTTEEIQARLKRAENETKKEKR